MACEACTDHGADVEFARLRGALKSVIGGDLKRVVFAAGETRAMDVLAMEYDTRVGVMDLTGAQIADWYIKVGPKPV